MFFFRPTVKNQFLLTLWTLLIVETVKIAPFEASKLLEVSIKDDRFARCGGYIKI